MILLRFQPLASLKSYIIPMKFSLKEEFAPLVFKITRIKDSYNIK